MNKLDADKIIEEYIQKLYGFSVNKLGDPDEAEELSARIVAEVYEVLVRRENIVNLNGYIYKIAHNIWTRYIGRKSKGVLKLPAEEQRGGLCTVMFLGQ